MSYYLEQVLQHFPLPDFPRLAWHIYHLRLQTVLSDNNNKDFLQLWAAQRPTHKPSTHTASTSHSRTTHTAPDSHSRTEQSGSSCCLDTACFPLEYALTRFPGPCVRVRVCARGGSVLCPPAFALTWISAFAAPGTGLSPPLYFLDSVLVKFLAYKKALAGSGKPQLKQISLPLGSLEPLTY